MTCTKACQQRAYIDLVQAFIISTDLHVNKKLVLAKSNLTLWSNIYLLRGSIWVEYDTYELIGLSDFIHRLGRTLVPVAKDFVRDREFIST